MRDRDGLGPQRERLAEARAELADAFEELSRVADESARVARSKAKRPPPVDVDRARGAWLRVARAEEAHDLAGLDLHTAAGGHA